MKLKELPVKYSLKNMKFINPKTGNICYWDSHKNHKDNSFIWYKLDPNDMMVYPLIMDNIFDALELEIVQ